MAEDVAWVGEWLQQFLKSPVWTAPVQSFVDDNCDAFDDLCEDEHKLEYTKIHKEFCLMVEELLAENLQAMGVSNQMFLDAVGSSSSGSELDSLVKEYVLCLDDFLTFRKMMEKRNVEIELELMQSYADLADSGPSAPQEGGGGGEGEPKQSEEEMIAQALKASIEETDVRTKQVQMEDAQLQHALAISLATEEERHQQAEEEITAKVSDREEQQEKIDELRKVSDQRKQDIQAEILEARIEVAQKTPAVQLAQKAADMAAASLPSPCVPAAPAPSPAAESPTPAAPSPILQAPAPAAAEAPAPRPAGSQTATMDKLTIAPLVTKQPLPALGRKAPLPGLAPGANPTFEQLQQKVIQAEHPKQPELQPAPAKAGPSEDEVRRRMEMMKQQRDRLLAAKKESREKELDAYIKEKTGKEPAATGGGTQDASQKEDMRKALARRVKEDLLSGH